MLTENSCLLFLPALEARFWRKLPDLAGSLRGVIIDLEDSIHPDAKTRARDAVRDQLSVLERLRNSQPHLELILRVNNRHTRFYEGDLELVDYLGSEALLTTVMYPKIGSAEEVELVSRAVPESIALFLAIETLSGYSAHREILAQNGRIRYVAIGAEDLCADMSLERPAVFYDNPLLNHIAATVALQAKLAGIQLWGNIWPYLSSSELFTAFQREVDLDQQFGAVGKVIFHPYQIDVVNRGFNLASREEAQRQRMLGRLEAIAQRVEAHGLTVAIHNGRMVDMPEYVRLRKWYDTLDDPAARQEVQELLPNVFTLP